MSRRVDRHPKTLKKIRESYNTYSHGILSWEKWFSKISEKRIRLVVVGGKFQRTLSGKEQQSLPSTVGPKLWTNYRQEEGSHLEEMSKNPVSEGAAKLG